jgi:hypothetical protein
MNEGLPACREPSIHDDRCYLRQQAAVQQAPSQHDVAARATVEPRTAVSTAIMKYLMMVLLLLI